MDIFLIFLGAGASAPFGIPTMTQMAEEFEANLKKRLPPYITLFDDIKYQLKGYESFDIEALLTVLQDIIEIDKMHYKVFNKPSVHYFSSWGLLFQRMIEINKDAAKRKHSDAEKLLKEVKGFIAERCLVKNLSFDIYHEFFQQVMVQNGIDYWGSIQRSGTTLNSIRCVIFTTNYDQVIEAYCRRKKLDYECGQLANELLEIGASNDRLYLSSENLFQIHKLHGSINWYEDQDKNLRWLTEAAQSGKTTLMGEQIIKELLIYPAQEKYTFREPFYSMFHALKDQLIKSRNCYVVGYSFRDDDILGLFHDAMDLNKSLRIFLIDHNADKIVKDKFNRFSDRIKQLPMEFSVDSARMLESLH